jgi:proton glutamate symport protein
VVVAKPELAPLYMAFPINKNDHGFELFMGNWISMKQQSKTIDKLFNY